MDKILLSTVGFRHRTLLSLADGRRKLLAEMYTSQFFSFPIQIGESTQSTVYGAVVTLSGSKNDSIIYSR